MENTFRSISSLYSSPSPSPTGMSTLPRELVNHIGSFLDPQSRAHFAATGSSQREAIENTSRLSWIAAGKYLNMVGYEKDIMYSEFLLQKEESHMRLDHKPAYFVYNIKVCKILMDTLNYVYEALQIKKEIVRMSYAKLGVVLRLNFPLVPIEQMSVSPISGNVVRNQVDYSVQPAIDLGAVYVYRTTNTFTMEAEKFAPMFLMILENVISRMGYRMLYKSYAAEKRFGA